MICTSGIVVSGRELRGEWRKLHNMGIYGMNSRHFGVREGVKRGLEKSA